MPDRLRASHPTADSLPLPARTLALKIALSYAAVGAGWVLIIGWILRTFVANRAVEEPIETALGWGFILVTALLLWKLLDRYFGEIRRRALQVQAAEAQVRQIGENLPIGYIFQYQLDAQSRPVFTYISGGVEKVHGIPATEVLQNAAVLHSQIDADQWGALRKAQEESARLEQDFRMDLRIQRTDRRRHLINIHSRPRRYEDGVTRWDGLAIDVTDERKARTALQESEARFRALFDYSPDGVLVADTQERCILLVNETMSGMLGYPSSEAARLKVADLHPAAERSRVMAEFDAMVANNRHLAKSIPVVRKDGTIFQADISASQFTMGTRQCLVAVFRDITERQVAEARSRIKHDLLLALAAATRLEEGLALCVDAAIKVAGLDSGGFYLQDPDTRALHLCVHRGLSAAFVAATTRLPADSAQAVIAAAGVPIFADFAALELAQTTVEIQEGLRAIAIIPVCYQGRLIGCMNVASHTSGEIASAERLALETIAAGAAQAIVRLRAQEALRESEQRYRALFDEAIDGILLISQDGESLSANAAFARMHGYPDASAIASLKLSDLDTPACAAEAPERLRRISQGENLTFEVEHYRQDGSTFPLSVTGSRINLGGRWYLLAFHRDISQQKRAQHLQALSADVLRILNDASALPEATQRILEAIRRETGFEAVGIRLREGKDFPYAVAEGFSQAFLETENHLAMRKRDGEFCVDEHGCVRLECTCGLVLSGLTDPANPLFTTGGSAWTNDACPLLHVPAEQDPRLHPRNRCIHEGYQSVGLVPIRVGKEIVGLLQLNDRRKGCFTVEMIRYFEGLAASFGVALLRLREAHAVRESQSMLQALFDAVPESLFLMDPKGIILAANAGFSTRFARNAANCLGESLYNLVPPGLIEVRRSWIAEVIRTQKPVVNEEQWGENWLRHHYCPVFNEGNEVHRIVVLALNITARREAEMALRESELRRTLALDAARMGTWDLDLQTNQLRWTGTHEALWGYAPGTFPGTYEGFTSRIHPLDLEALQQLGTRARESRSAFQMEFRVIWPDASLHWVSSSGSYLFDRHGEAIRMVGVVFDITERKQAEQTLAAEATRRRILVEGSRDGIVVLDQQGRVYESNRRFAEMLGYSDAEMRQLHVWDWDDQWSREQLLEAIRVLGPEGDHFETRQRRKDGSRFDVEVSTNAAELGGQKLVFCVCRDISERVRVERTLQQSLLFRREAEKIARIGAWKVSPATDYLYWTEGVYEILEAPLDYKPGLQEGLRYYDAESIPALQLALQKALQDGTPFVIETGLTTHTGKHLWTEVRGLGRLEDGGQAYVMGTFQDVTERRQAAAALKEREEVFSSIVAQAVDAIALIEPSTGQFIEFNQAAHEGLGYTRAEFAELCIEDIQADHSAEIIRQNIEKVQQGGTLSFDTKHLHRNGQLRDVRVSTRFLRVRGRDYVAAAWSDITDKRRLEQQLRQAQKLEAVGQLAGGVAHDFNNILAAIMMHLGLLQTSSELNEETRVALKDLDAEARRAASLTRQLLMFSRRSVLAVRPLDVNEVIANLLKMLNRLIGENIKLRFDGDSRLPLVEADAGMLEQVVMNLVVNARDAMPKGGRVTIGTTLASFQTPDLGVNPSRQPGDFVCLHVSDTGTGMDDSTLKRIFEPFFTTKEVGKGTGLGLATVHGIIAQHKGWVEVESQLDQGTTFRVYLPALAKTIIEAPAGAPAEPLQRGSETILLVEDENEVRRTVGQALRVLGYLVHLAENGQQAMRLWQTHGNQVDLLLTDMVMPEGMTGLELAEQLRQLKPGLKVIISSGYTAEMVRAGVPDKPGLIYLPKPYDLLKLAEVVRKCLDQKTGD